MTNVENIGVGCAELRILVRPEVHLVRLSVALVPGAIVWVIRLVVPLGGCLEKVDKRYHRGRVLKMNLRISNFAVRSLSS
jgi:hypothetical protein